MGNESQCTASMTFSLQVSSVVNGQLSNCQNMHTVILRVVAADLLLRFANISLKQNDRKSGERSLFDPLVSKQTLHTTHTQIHSRRSNEKVGKLFSLFYWHILTGFKGSDQQNILQNMKNTAQIECVLEYTPEGGGKGGPWFWLGSFPHPLLAYNEMWSCTSWLE